MNKESGLKYIGQSIKISNRMGSYFSNSYLKSKQNLFICRVLLKHGHQKFKLIILEYCEVSDLQKREQYYFDLYHPEYNILK